MDFRFPVTSSPIRIGEFRRRLLEALPDLLPEPGAEDAVDEDVDAGVEDEEDVRAVGEQVGPDGEGVVAVAAGGG